MLLMFTGVILLGLGLFSGITLVLSPMGWVNFQAGWLMWLVFPLFSLFGYCLCAIPSKLPMIRGITLTVSSLLLILAVLSAVVLVLMSASLIPVAVSGETSLWYVMIIGGLLGIAGAATRQTD